MAEDNEFRRGATVPIWTPVKDWDGNYVTPTSVKVSVWNPSGILVVDAQAADEDEPGKYVYYYKLASDAPRGWWPMLSLITDGTGDAARVTIPTGAFKVI